MSTNVGKKNVAHTKSAHGAVAPGAISLVTPPAPPAPTPFVYTVRAANAKGTAPSLLIGGGEALVKDSTMDVDPPANQPSQSGGGDVVTHATSKMGVMLMGSMLFTSDGKEVCGTGDLCAMNVLQKTMHVAQMQVPLLEGPDFDAAKGSVAAAAAMNRLYKRAYPPSRADATKAGHPVDLGTGYVVDDAVDLALPGHIPLVWSRSYSSAAAKHRGSLGRGGWSHSFEQWLEETESGIRLWDEEGLPVDFAPPTEGAESFHRGKRLSLRVQGRGFEVRSLSDRLVRRFTSFSGGRSWLSSISDARGHQIRLQYDGQRLSRILDTVGREIHLLGDPQGRVRRVEVWASAPGTNGAPSLQIWFDYAYHPEGELASHTNALGQTSSWEYDGLHRMTKATLRNGVAFRYEYHPEFGHCSRTRGEGGIHDVSIDIDFEKGETRTYGTGRARLYRWKKGIVVHEETFDGHWATSRELDDDELTVTRTNGAGETTSYALDARGNIVEEVDPAGNSTTWEIYDDQPISRTDAAGLVTRFAYDRYGTLSDITFPTGLTLHMEVNREGQCMGVFDAQGQRLGLAYDEHGNLSAETSARGATTIYHHDALGRRLSQTDALGRETNARYDVLGRPVQITAADGSQIAVTYDKLGNLASFTDQLGKTTTAEHVGTGYLAKLTGPDGQSHRFFYDDDERLVRVLNSRLESYEFEYDRVDNVIAERTFDDRLLTYRRDRAGRVVRIDLPEGEWREFRRDKLGLIVEDRGSDVQLTYVRDALGRVMKATSSDAMGVVTTEIEWDVFGRIVADIQGDRAVRYEHDTRGRRSARVLPDGTRTEYYYDFDDLLALVTHSGAEFRIERDRLGREVARASNGVRIERAYDRLDRVAQQIAVLVGSSGTADPSLFEERLYRDSKGRVTAVDSSVFGRRTFLHDPLDRLVEATRTGRADRYEYDPTGSLVGMDHGESPSGSTWSFARGNRLLATERATFVNDDRGRRIRRLERADGKDPRRHPPRGDERMTTYGWDSRDRLREVVLPDGVRVRFQYDAFGRRVRKDVLPPPDLSRLLGEPSNSPEAQSVRRMTTHFLWDGEVLCGEERRSGAEIETRVHVHEPETFLPMLESRAGKAKMVIHDQVGVPIGWIGDDGKDLVWVERSPWGEVVAARGGESLEPFQLLGQHGDGHTGLSHALHRCFDPTTARWLSPDPLGFAGGPNAFAFDGSPAFVVDPLGLCAPGPNDPAIKFLERGMAMQGLTAPPAGFKQKWTENGHTFEARIHPADPAHGKTGGIFRVGKQAVPDPTNPKAQGTGQSYVDPSGTWHHTSVLKPNSPNYNPQAAKDTHVQL